MWFGSTQIHAQIPDLTRVSCVNLSQLCNLSEPVLPHL